MDGEYRDLEKRKQMQFRPRRSISRNKEKAIIGT